ncbi:MAG TPA: transglycosylase SLT domain-containing protein [Polyangiaceae bacterium]|nr:transglycosylase SLT domain-containing protein [Polyangiaceae bacterium]
MLKALILAIMIDLLHPSVQRRSYTKEPLADAQQRYESIADDISAVVMDENEPPLFAGPAGREATGALLSAIAWHESGFRKDVDVCKGARSKGDNGRSVGLLQVMRGPNYEGHSATEICEDRRLAIRLGLHVLRRAKESCHGSPRTWMQSYAAGGCGIRSNVSRDVCDAFERTSQKRLSGATCSSVGPVTLKESSGS